MVTGVVVQAFLNDVHIREAEVLLFESCLLVPLVHQ